MGTEARQDLPVVGVDRLSVGQVGEGHESNSNGVTLQLRLLSLDVLHDACHFLAVEIRSADTGVSTALTGRAEEAAGVGRHLQVFTGFPAIISQVTDKQVADIFALRPLIILTESNRSLSSLQLLVE